MTGRAFVDTNVWVYAADGADLAKQAQAAALLSDPERSLVTSAQVLGEFLTVVTRKLARPVPVDTAIAMVERMCRLPVAAIDADLVRSAIAGMTSWRIAYWDALVVAAASASGCETLLTEDLADGALYGGVRVENPFRSRRQVGEVAAAYHSEAAASRWDEVGLRSALGAYEQACRDAGMLPNAVHSYWDYARRFLDWRTGEYAPRGTASGRRPVPMASVSASELEAQAAAYARDVEAAGREPASVDTYYRHAMFFVRWLRGDFAPGARLRGRRRR